MKKLTLILALADATNSASGDNSFVTSIQTDLSQLPVDASPSPSPAATSART